MSAIKRVLASLDDLAQVRESMRRHGMDPAELAALDEHIHALRKALRG